ncbi:MAG: DUF2961 domain-containing protein [Planctomycetota bacterium]
MFTTFALAAIAFIQFEEVVDPRTLVLPHTGKVKYYNSAEVRDAQSRPAASIVESDGTILLAKSVGGGGRLARLWMIGGHERTKLRAYFDGASAPAIHERIGTAFEDGRTPLVSLWTFAPALAAGARVSYAPIRYRRDATITVSSRVDAYEIEFIEGETVNANIFPIEPKIEEYDIPVKEFVPGQPAEFAADDGAGMITMLKFTVEAPGDFDYNKTKLQIFVDGEAEPGIQCSFAHLFAKPEAAVNVAAMAVEVTDADMILHLPIPYTKGCKIQIVNGGEKNINIRGAAVLNRDPLPPKTRRLRILEWGGDVSPGAPLAGQFSSRAGHFIGLTATFDGPRELQLGGKLQFAADHQVIYRSHTIASAFDGGAEFGKEVFATIGAGLSHAAPNSRTAFCFRIGRPLPFEKGFVVQLTGPDKEKFHASGAVFLYESIAEPKPSANDAGAKK